ncbi:MAG: CPBP family intramembrane metalloprotease [Pseudonocardia sp.]|nr:CPBP family intramembrane metalloprotease [Pseudonocardia sp.]
MTSNYATSTHAGATGQPPPVPGRRLLAALGIWVAVAGTAGAATYYLVAAMAPSWATGANLGALISAEVYLALVIVFIAVIGRPLAWRTPTRRDLAHGVLAALAVWAAVTVVYLAIWPLLGSLDGLFEVLTFIGTDGGRIGTVGVALAVLSIARAVVITPLAEELLFRGALFGWLRRHWPVWPTIAVTAAAFAAVHGFLMLMPAAVVFGIVTAWLRERTGAVAAGFVAHVLSNAMLVTVITVVT